MAKFRVPVLLTILGAVTLLAPAALADGVPKAPARMGLSQFVEEVASAIECIHDVYFVEIEQGQLLRWAVQGVYSRQGRSVPPEIDERLDRARHHDGKELRSLLTEVGRDGDGDHGRWADLALDAHLRHLDDRCAISDWDGIIYTYPSDRRFGTGVRLSTDPSTGLIRVVFPFRDGPAYKAGLRSGDLLTEIARTEEPLDGRPAKRRVLATRGLKLSRAYEELLGRAGTPVRLKVRRPGAGAILEVEVVHTAAEEETVFGARRQADDRWDHWLDPGRKIGYVRVSRFGRNTHREVVRVIDRLHKQGLKGLVLDLRCNGGGLVRAAIDIAGLLVGEAPIVSCRDRTEERGKFSGKPGQGHLGFPVACLVNGETGGTAEVVAAALQDNRRAVIVGERTQGNASIRGQYQAEHSLLKLITAVYYRPCGKKLDRIHAPGKPSDEWGVMPDKGYELRLPALERDRLRHLEGLLMIPPRGRGAREPVLASEDRQLGLAVTYLRERIIGAESSDLPVRLGSIPKLILAPRPPLAAEEVARIKEHIARLADIDNADYGLSSTMSGSAFLPLAGQAKGQAFLLTDHRLRSAPALQALVERGPDALPFLLANLDNKKPTKLQIEHRFAGGAMWLANELWGNPVNPVELTVLGLDRERRRGILDDILKNAIDSYTVRVGDVCLVAIGQIVGRDYQAVRYQPTSCIVINSPTKDAKLREQVRAIWSSTNSAKRLFNSFLLDYATEGNHTPGDSFDRWYAGSNLQVEAAMRLLYYFPKESAPMIARRLGSLCVERTGPGAGSLATAKQLVFLASKLALKCSCVLC